MHSVSPAVLPVQLSWHPKFGSDHTGQGTILSCLKTFGMSDSEIVRDVIDVCHAIYELSHYLIKLTGTVSSTPFGL